MTKVTWGGKVYYISQVTAPHPGKLGQELKWDLEAELQQNMEEHCLLSGSQAHICSVLKQSRPT